jgi:singapore isolate B (sub-type 7) whole genome shotgun sequence assembly, scaffold_7
VLSVKPLEITVRKTSFRPFLLLNVVSHYASHSVEITNFLSDIKTVATTYPGGVLEYIRKAKKLIQDSTQGVNPFDGYEAKVAILWEP